MDIKKRTEEMQSELDREEQEREKLMYLNDLRRQITIRRLQNKRLMEQLG